MRPDAAALTAEDDRAQDDRVLAAASARMPEAVARLADLVRIPSVSAAAFDPAFVQQSAQAVAELFTRTGLLETVTVARAPLPNGEDGLPAVLGWRQARNGRPTVLLYAHHDVQPAGDHTEWTSPPFEPTLANNRLFGRGAADDKGGILTHVTAMHVLADVLGDDLELGIGLFIEGEEEINSRSFAAFIDAHRRELAADVIIVADSNNWSRDIPALTVSLRGKIDFTITVATLHHAVHSGVSGGAAPDAMLALTRILASFHDDAGSVAIDGLLTAAEPSVTIEEGGFRTDSAMLDTTDLIGQGTIAARLWTQPAVTVTGMDIPDVAHATSALLPRVSARISVRTAPGHDIDDAAEAIRAHIRRHTPFGATVTISELDAGRSTLIDTGDWAGDEARRALGDGWGSPAVETGVGGTIPFIGILQTAFPDAQILATGVLDPDSRPHSTNESIDLAVFERAIRSEALLLARLNRREPGIDRSR